MSLLSVIIPIYNVAPYLHDCLGSIINQDFSDWEAICIDDGSTDSCGEIADQYAKKDARFKVIHQRNGGVSAARNAGLSAASGEYVIFVDGDDIVDSCLFSELAHVLLERRPDQLCYGHVNFPDVERPNLQATYDHCIRCTSGAAMLSDDAQMAKFVNCVWDKAYKLEMLRGSGLDFLEGLTIGEDSMFAAQAMAFSKNISICEGIRGYFYRERMTSALHTQTLETMKQALSKFMGMKSFCKKCGVLAYRNVVTSFAKFVLFQGCDGRKGLRDDYVSWLVTDHRLTYVLRHLMAFGGIKIKLWAFVCIVVPTQLRKMMLLSQGIRRSDAHNHQCG